MIEFENNEELKSYVEEHKIIKESIKCDFNISLNTDLIVKGNITAWNINADDINADDINANDIDAWNIKARNIDAWNIISGNIDAINIDARNIDAWHIKAWDISYDAVCFAYDNIVCNSIKGIRRNSRHFALDGELKINIKEV